MPGTATSVLNNHYKRALNPNHTNHEVLPVPVRYYVGLMTGPGGLSAGSPTDEVNFSNTGYQRQQFTFNDNLANATDITFPSPTPNNWGTLTHFCIFAELDSAHSGAIEAWWYGRLQDPTTGNDLNLMVNAGGPPVWFQAGLLTVNLS